MRNLIISLLLVFGSSVGFGMEEGLCPKIAAEGSVVQLPALSDQTFTELKEILRHTFQNSDAVFRIYRREKLPHIAEIKRIGSDVSLNSYGVFKVQGETLSALKIGLKYQIEDIFDYFDAPEITLLPFKFDPFEQTDQSAEAIEGRRAAGFGILLLHFFNEMERVTGIKMTSRLFSGFSATHSRQLTRLYPEATKMPERLAEILTGSENGNGRTLSPETHISFGVFTEFLKITSEARDDGFQRQDTSKEFAKLPGVREQSIWIVRTLNRLGIEMMDPNLVLDDQGRVLSIDLDGSGVIVDGPAGKQAYLGETNSVRRSLLLNKLLAAGIKNEAIQGRCNLNPEDIAIP